MDVTMAEMGRLTGEQREMVRVPEGAGIRMRHVDKLRGSAMEGDDACFQLTEKEMGRLTVPVVKNVEPIKMECRKSVGVKGDKLKLDSFGIELDIPPGAIDSKAPQDISLRVLTDTPNLGNSKTEMSVCFGVQCLAPDDLVLKLPVTYTIPHCAVITKYSSVEAVLYTGEGEYSPDAVVKERIMLSRSRTSSFIITKDVIKLTMNHFSWAKIKLITNIFREKKMCCLPFKERKIALQKRSVILHVHLYDDIEGNREFVQSVELKKYVPAHMEQRVSIQTAEGDLKMTCYLKETVIGGPTIVSYDRLMSGTSICVPFELDFPNQSDSVAVSLKVGQNEKLEVDFKFRLEDGIQEASPQDQASAEVVSITGVVAGHGAVPDTRGDPPSNITMLHISEKGDGKERKETKFKWTGDSKQQIFFLGIVLCVGVGLFILSRRKN